jgi:hypothetical protein
MAQITSYGRRETTESTNLQLLSSPQHTPWATEKGGCGHYIGLFVSREEPGSGGEEEDV